MLAPLALRAAGASKHRPPAGVEAQNAFRVAPRQACETKFAASNQTPRALKLTKALSPPEWLKEYGYVIAFSGFIPSVRGFQPSFGDRGQTRAFVAHGRNDPVIDVSFARKARDALEAAGLDVEYVESDLGHQIAPTHVPAAASWLASTITPASA